MNPVVASIIEDNMSLYLADPNYIEAEIETVAVAVSILIEALIEETDEGFQRGLLYDIATAAILAIEKSYDD